MTKTIAILCLAALLAGGCDKRETARATIARSGDTLTFDGDRSACLREAGVATQESKPADEASYDDEHPWKVSAAEGQCLHFPFTFGVAPAGAKVSGSGQTATGERYDFVAASDTHRYQASFEQGSNGIFYVRDAGGTYTDIARARQ